MTRCEFKARLVYIDSGKKTKQTRRKKGEKRKEKRGKRRGGRKKEGRHTGCWDRRFSVGFAQGVSSLAFDPQKSIPPPAIPEAGPAAVGGVHQLSLNLSSALCWSLRSMRQEVGKEKM